MPIKDPDKRREYNRIYNRQYYEQDPDRQIARNKARVRVVREWLDEFKKTVFCAHCGERHPACLDFHHEDPSQKEYLISYIAYSGWGLARIKQEIAKCTVLCANCHRKLHWEEREAALVAE